MKKLFFLLLTLIILFNGCNVLKNLSLPDIEKNLNTIKPLTNEEVVSGLKEALNIGTNSAIKILNKTNGFYGDPLVKIIFPPEAQFVADKLYSVGLGKLVDDFIKKMNEGAEAAVVKAGPIFTNAIKTMTFTDAMSILKGADNAATQYFKDKTSAQLISAFKPEVQSVLNQL